MSDTLAVALNDIWRAVFRGAMGRDWAKPEVPIEIKVESGEQRWGLITPILWDYAWKQLKGTKPRTLGIDRELSLALFFLASVQVLLGRKNAVVWLEHSRPLEFKFREILGRKGPLTPSQRIEIGRLEIIYNVDRIVKFNPAFPRRERLFGVPFPTPKIYRKFFKPSKEEIEAAESSLIDWVDSLPELKRYRDPVIWFLETESNELLDSN